MMDKPVSIYKKVASGSVTQANMRISAVDGTTFIDFSAADVLTTKIGHLVRIKDSSNRTIEGYIKAVGTAETLSDELLVPTILIQAGWTDNLDGSYTAVSAGYSAIYKNVSTALALYKMVWTIDSRTAGTTGWYLGTNTGGSESTPATYTKYGTCSNHTNSVVGFQSINFSGVISSLSAKQVTMPSATGVTIVSTKGGSTFNFANKNSAFNYNDASGYTYEIIKVNNAVVVASGSIAANQALMDTTSDNAFVAPVGVDLSPYQDGRHMFRMQNTTGSYVAFGYISSVAPAGEALTEKLANSTFASDEPPGTAWTKNANATISGGVASLTSLANCYQAINVSTGQLLKSVIVQNSGANTNFYADLATGSSVIISVGTTTFYNTKIGLGLHNVGFYGAGTCVIESASNSQVTMPVATGALIVSTQGGATRAFAYKHASFDPNLASTYQILYLGD